MLRYTSVIFLCLLVILINGCRSGSKVTSYNAQANLNDVRVLSILISKCLQKTVEEDFDLDQLILGDSLKRVSGNFERTQLVYHGGHIAVKYKFSGSRNSIELTDEEKQLTANLRVIEKNLKEEYDGEIQLEYGERFYHIKKIVTRK